MDNQDFSTEEWRPVLGWEDSYEVSSHGRVRGIRQKSRWVGKRIRSLKTKKVGYIATILYRSGRQKDVLVHVLVAEAFICPKPEGMEVNHKDSNRANNHFYNLEWVTHKENQEHAAKAGRYASGDRHPRRTKPEAWAGAVFAPRPGIQGERNCSARTTNDRVREVKLARRDGLSYSQLMKRFDLPKHIVARICTGRNWACVTID